MPCGLRVSTNPVKVIAGQAVQVTLEGQSANGVISLLSSDPAKASVAYSTGIITVTGVATTWVDEVPAVVAAPPGCGVAPAAACTTPAKPAVAAHDEPVTVTVIDSGPPTRNQTFKVTMLKKTP